MEASSHREEKITRRLQHLNRLEPTSELITLESVTGENAHLPRVEAEFQGGPHRTRQSEPFSAKAFEWNESIGGGNGSGDKSSLIHQLQVPAGLRVDARHQ